MYQQLLYSSTQLAILLFSHLVLNWAIFPLNLLYMQNMDHSNYMLDMWPLLKYLLFLDSSLLCFHHLYIYCLYMLLLNIFLQLIECYSLLIILNYFHLLLIYTFPPLFLFLFLLHLYVFLLCLCFLLILFHILLLFHLILDYHFHRILLFVLLKYYLDNIFLCLHQYLFLL